jgi:hypothetical protein
VQNVPTFRIATCLTDKLSNYLLLCNPALLAALFSDHYTLRGILIVELSNYLLLTPPYWAALFSDDYTLRGVLRLGAFFIGNKLLG